MIELYLNKKMAALPEELNFTFLQENPYFTSNSNSSLNIELPLYGCMDNLNIFGHINRLDVTKKRVVLDAELRASGVVYLSGSAIVNEITDASVKIQLVSGNSEFNFRTNADIYIDDIDLGRISFPSFPVATAWLDTAEKYKFFGFYGQVDGVWLPVKYEDKIHNMVVYELGTENFHPRPWFNDHCVQPYLLTVIHKLVEWAGYKIGRNDIEDCFLKHLYIVNAIQTTEIAKALPHWTISEFWDEIEKFCSVVVVVDEITKEVNFISLSDYYADKDFIQIDNVVSEYSVTISENSDEKDISTGNVGYNHPSNDPNKYYCLSRDILNMVDNKQFGTWGALESAYNALSKDDKVTFFATFYSRNYINNRDEKGTDILKEVNQFGDLIRDINNDSNDVSLKIVPAALELYNLGVYNSSADPALGTPPMADLQLWVPLTSYFTELPKDEKFNVQEAIDNDVSEQIAQRDIMEVAFNTGMKAMIAIEYQGQIHSFGYNCPFTDGDMILPNQNNSFSDYSLSLHPVCNDSIGQRISELKSINSDIQYNIQFLYNGKLDPKKIFIINNKKYVCEHIELEADKNGFSKLVNGFFYRIE